MSAMGGPNLLGSMANKKRERYGRKKHIEQFWGEKVTQDEKKSINKDVDFYDRIKRQVEHNKKI